MKRSVIASCVIRKEGSRGKGPSKAVSSSGRYLTAADSSSYQKVKLVSLGAHAASCRPCNLLILNPSKLRDCSCPAG